MQKKLRQVTDTIHQTVYLSELESNMMSTAYFYRLHDIYQSSTVYLTFPCNRTKRYEHSYGTMELAGEMFFSAITNATPKVLEEFFTEAERELKTIVKTLLKNDTVPTYCNSSQAAMSGCFPNLAGRDINRKLDSIIKAAYDNFIPIEDTALNHYMPPFSKDLNKHKFLYQCLLEAVRIVALFHDVGHPPYSHILENTLKDLYQKCSNSPEKYNTDRADELIKYLEPFFKGTSDQSINCLISTPNEPKNGDKVHMHEQVGLKMLAGAFDDIFQYELERIGGSPKAEKSSFAIYLVAVAEFCFAILRDQNSFFISLHRIIDGCIDTDRMDYVVRDAQNSGVDWGKVPYKRLLDSCKLMQRQYDNQTYYPIAFPRKMTDQIDDLLLMRYKIFARINYHHRSYKTAIILQRLVQDLAEDYLKKDDGAKALCPGISDLWNCLGSTLSSHDLYIIQWNDSTLISHLYQTLAEIKRNDSDDYNLTDEQYKDIISMLEEFLLNRKHFYSVFKRQSDFVPIFEAAFNDLDPLVKKIKAHEQKKIEEASGPDDFSDADDSIKRLDPIKLEGVIHSGDGKALECLFPSEYSLKNIIVNVLKEYHTQGKIGVYLFNENKKRTATGLPKRADLSDAIYLYEPNSDTPDIYNTSILENQLVQLQNNCLQYIAYIELEPCNSKTIEDIRNTICNKFTQATKAAMGEYFSCV